MDPKEVTPTASAQSLRAELLRELDATEGSLDVYLVQGVAGSYDGHSEWQIAVYIDEKDAAEHVAKATEAFEKLWDEASGEVPDDSYGYGIDFNKYSNLSNKLLTGETANPWDPYMHVDFTGTKYSYRKVRLFASLTQPQRKNLQNEDT